VRAAWVIRPFFADRELGRGHPRQVLD